METDAVEILCQIRDSQLRQEAAALWSAPWVTPETVAAMLGLDRETVLINARKQRIPAHKLPGIRGWMFKPRELDAWLLSGDANDIVVDIEAKDIASNILSAIGYNRVS